MRMAAPVLVAWVASARWCGTSSIAEEFGELSLSVGAEVVQLQQGLAWFGFSYGCLPRSRPLAFATFIPFQVRSRIRSASNSATIASTLNSSRPTGSVGS